MPFLQVNYKKVHKKDRFPLIHTVINIPLMQLTYINDVTWNLWLAYHTKKSHLYFFIIIAEGTKALKTPTEDPEVESFIKVQ